MDSVIFFNGEFINLYTKDNPILDINDVTYFMFTNTTDYHRPLIAKGVVMFDKFCDGMNKQYFIKIIEILESPKTISDFFLGKSFDVFAWFGGEVHSKKTTLINSNFDYNTQLFKVEAFFVRNDEKKIFDLRSEYIKLIRTDINKMLQDIDSI